MFVPKISITAIPSDASSMLVTDITGNTTDSTPDTTGYIDASYAYYPQDGTEWYKFLTASTIGSTQTQYLYDPSTDYYGTTSATVTLSLTDGVWLVTEYWMKPVSEAGGTLDYTIDATRKILTRVSGTAWADAGAVPGLFSGVFGVGKGDNTIADLSDLSEISSVTSTTLTLKSALNADVLADGDLNLFYRVQKYILVMNVGEASLISDIGDMAISALAGQGCDDVVSTSYAHRMILKLAAQIHFACGNYVKAHNAATLFSGTSSLNSNCTSC